MFASCKNVFYASQNIIRDLVKTLSLLNYCSILKMSTKLLILFGNFLLPQFCLSSISMKILLGLWSKHLPCWTVFNWIKLGCISIEMVFKAHEGHNYTNIHDWKRLAPICYIQICVWYCLLLSWFDLSSLSIKETSEIPF